jgi:tetratricopeptide (TPR) repeat protein
VGLALVRRRTGDLAGARKEAMAALALGPSADAYMVLAQLDLAANDLKNAQANAENALKVDPSDNAAQQFLQLIQARGNPPR